ncbi:flagellar protein FlaG [Shewanella sp. UCD-KL12]|uniref:flagellar protein FlaG n=1 Tax=Shewanella sp. UCD-KL12 TaxID=1917163 RepID=UPI000970353A|nr:flagellar protein FlaG [Shewanella sp. UCD-KL12]
MDINALSSSNSTGAKVDLSLAPIKQAGATDVELDRSSIIQAVEQAEKEKGAEQKQTPEELAQLVGDLSDMMSVMRKGLAFKIDESSGQNIVSVMDIDSGDLIRQIPNEEALKLAQKLSEVTGLLMKTEA